ncbi:MAG: TIGR04084 family radical SAM/SPASM domain-containing protein [Methanomicrobium sp.]|nr:TIGR04084 family radical SAM/SPASM domain-containing protein [Methanomicrobium sp.]
MHYFILLTDECNLCCEYCRGKIFTIDSCIDHEYGCRAESESDSGCDLKSDSKCDPESDPESDSDCESCTVNTVNIDESLPCDFEPPLETLYNFLRQDEDAILTFYGGEPLIRDDLIRKIMDNAPVKEYIIQTNAVLLDRLEPRYVNRFKSIFASIDGDRKTTDANRGEGVYDKVIANLKDAVKNGYRGELIARMTVSEVCDIYESVRYLSENDDFSFGARHWQMDSNFWEDFELRPDYVRWVTENYNPGIRRLAKYWVDRMESDGIVMMWYPFVDTMQDMLLGRTRSPLRCGSGFENYSIVQDGHIAPCPCMAGMKDYYCGDIATSDPKNLRKIDIGGECNECDIRDFCGGRCLYSNITMPWSKEGRRLVYESVKNLKTAMEVQLPRVKRLIADGKITVGQFNHVKYNGCEIIP